MKQPTTLLKLAALVSAVLLSYRSAARRRIHCRWHNAIHGLAYYALTVLTGWIGIGVFSYPLVVYAAARNLSPWIGRASIVLGILPPCVAALLIVRWFV